MEDPARLIFRQNLPVCPHFRGSASTSASSAPPSTFDTKAAGKPNPLFSDSAKAGIHPHADGIHPHADGIHPHADGIHPHADGIHLHADGISRVVNTRGCRPIVNAPTRKLKVCCRQVPDALRWIDEAVDSSRS